MKKNAGSPIGRKLMKRIKADGFTCIGLMPADGKPGWTYTVGFCRIGFPELVIPDFPGPNAVVYLEQAANAFYREHIVPSAGSSITMVDASVWTVREGNPRASEYGTPWALRLFGDRFKVRCLRLDPPRSLAWPKFSPWPGSACMCGCTQPGPLTPLLGQVGTRHLNII